MKTLVIRLFFVFCAGTTVAACDFSEPCDPGQIYQGALCYDVPADAAPAADEGDGAAAGGKAFGTSCPAGTACGGETDYCAADVGAATGYCTHTGCLATPSICPVGWSCLDLSVYAPTLPAICVKP